MSTDTHQVTAKIYQFPVRSRRAVAGHRENAGAMTEPMSQSVCDAALSGCWYHEAAIQQSAGFTNP